MKVFISWSGPQSNYIAQALRDWLRDVVQNLNPWMSEVDIGAGERWGSKLWQELQDSNFGVVCLTAENIHASWLHFEAGALAKTVEGRVCPYLYQFPGMIHGPLSQFQWKQVDKQGTKGLLQNINKASLELTQRGIRPEDFDRIFENWWPQLEAKLKTVPPSTETAPQRDMQEMVEEFVDIVRDQARKIFTPEPMSVDNRVWEKWVRYMNLQHALTKMSPEDHAKIQGHLDNMKAALATLVVAPSKEPIPTSNAPLGEKKPSK